MSALTTTTDQRAPALTGRDLILHADNLNAMLTVAKFMSQAKQAVPKHLRGNEGGLIGDVDECGITDEERASGVNVQDLVL